MSTIELKVTNRWHRWSHWVHRCRRALLAVRTCLRRSSLGSRQSCHIRSEQECNPRRGKWIGASHIVYCTQCLKDERRFSFATSWTKWHPIQLMNDELTNDDSYNQKQQLLIYPNVSHFRKKTTIQRWWFNNSIHTPSCFWIEMNFEIDRSVRYFQFIVINI